MSLPDAPNTLREKYYSVMAGQNDADILPDIETAPSTENRYLDYIARNGGGGGDVTKAYVDEQDAKKTDKVTSAISGNFAGLDSNGNLTDSNKSAADFATASDMTAVQGVIPSTATTSNKLATASDVTNEDISSTSTTSPITDSADGMVQGLTIYGQSEVVEGEIKSVGEGWATVDLGTFGWQRISYNNIYHFKLTAEYTLNDALPPATDLTKSAAICSKYKTEAIDLIAKNNEYDLCIGIGVDKKIYCRDDSITDVETFKTAMSGVILAYQLADPTQGNAIAVKIDDGTGIDGTMATFTTTLPLRGVSDTVRDKLICTADSKQVETVCGKVRLADLTWNYNTTGNYFYTNPTTIISAQTKPLCDKYSTKLITLWSEMDSDKLLGIYPQPDFTAIRVNDYSYTIVPDFVASLGDAELVYELAEPVTTPLTTAEISAFRGLRTYDSTTNITITDEPEFELDYLKNTDNGQAVSNIQRDLQGQIDDKITVSPLLTLTVAGWDTSTLQQTVLYSHSTSLRNVIDVDPASVEEWAACGIIARYETASNITFTCKSIPENALSFKVTSMGV